MEQPSVGAMTQARPQGVGGGGGTKRGLEWGRAEVGFGVITFWPETWAKFVRPGSRIAAARCLKHLEPQVDTA